MVREGCTEKVALKRRLKEVISLGDSSTDPFNESPPLLLLLVLRSGPEFENSLKVLLSLWSPLDRKCFSS